MFTWFWWHNPWCFSRREKGSVYRWRKDLESMSWRLSSFCVRVCVGVILILSCGDALLRGNESTICMACFSLQSERMFYHDYDIDSHIRWYNERRRNGQRRNAPSSIFHMSTRTELENDVLYVKPHSSSTIIVHTNMMHCILCMSFLVSMNSQFTRFRVFIASTILSRSTIDNIID